MTKIFRTALAVVSLLLVTGTVASAQTFDWIVDDIDVYNMQVVKVVGQRLTVRIEETGKRTTFQVPKDFKFYIDDKPLSVGRLKPRQQLTAYVTRTNKGLILADAGPVRATPPDEPLKTPILAPAVPEQLASMLPSTGSLLPLIGLSGLGAFLIAGVARRFRRIS